MKLYRYVPIFSRAPEGVVLYRCFEVMGEGLTVQSKDFFPRPHSAAHSAQLESQFRELLLEQAPAERFPIKATIKEAIEAFDACFSE